MTSHQDVAGVVARLRDRSDHYLPDWARDTMDDAADLLENQAKALNEAERYLRGVLIHFVNEHCEPIPEWKPLPDLLGMLTQFDNASTVARELKARANAAEARLAEAMNVIEPFTNACLPFTLNGDCTMIPASAVEAARVFTNAAKEKT